MRDLLLSKRLFARLPFEIFQPCTLPITRLCTGKTIHVLPSAKDQADFALRAVHS
jgi:hypothetical protein